MTKQAGHHFAAKMVNAVLRKLAAAAREVFSEETVPALALAQAHPLWMVERWVALYGLDAAQAMCRYNQSQPHLCLRLADPKVELELAQEGITLERGHLLNAGRTVVSGDIAATAAFREGRVRIQDEGSQLVAEIASSLLANRNGSMLTRVRRGRKNLILAERNPQASIVCVRDKPATLEAMRNGLRRMSASSAGLPTPHICRKTRPSMLCLSMLHAAARHTRRNPEIRHRVRWKICPPGREAAGNLKAALRALRPAVLSSIPLARWSRKKTSWLSPQHSAKFPRSDRANPLDPRRHGAQSDSRAERSRATANRAYAGRSAPIIPGTFHCDGFFIAVLQRAELEVG